LSAFLLSWAPFRVTVRVGQISLFILALLLGSLLARRGGKAVLAGALLGLSLCKYTLTLPFVLYFAWKREWKLVSSAVLVPALLTEVFALRLGMPFLDVISQYVELSLHLLLTEAGHTGSTEVRQLILDLTSGNAPAAGALALALSAAALVSLAIVFARTPTWELFHLSALSLFALWAVYHRTYDSVFCLLPAALFTDLLMKRRFERFSGFWLGSLGLLVLSIPGLLVARLKMDSANLSSPLFFLGLHAERLLVFGMFWSLVVLMWKAGHSDPPGGTERKLASKATVAI
jgi:hypothetical protein